MSFIWLPDIFTCSNFNQKPKVGIILINILPIFFIASWEECQRKEANHEGFRKNSKIAGFRELFHGQWFGGTECDGEWEEAYRWSQW